MAIDTIIRNRDHARYHYWSIQKSDSRVTYYLLKYKVTLISLNCTKTTPIIDVGKIMSALPLPSNCNALHTIFTFAECYTFY